MTNYYLPLTDRVSDEPSSELSVALSERLNPGPNTSLLAGTTLQTCYDSVSLTALQGCLRKYNFKLIQGQQWNELPPALAWGRDFHTCTEIYHKCRAFGLDFETAVLRTARLAALLGEQLISLDTARTKETLVRSVVWYLDEYKDDPCKTAMLPNGKPAVELSFMLPIFDLQVLPTTEAQSNLPPLDLVELRTLCRELGYDYRHDALITMIRGARRYFSSITHIIELDSALQSALIKSFSTVAIHFSGHIDRVVHFGSEVFVADYKSSKYQLTLDWIRGFDMSTQFEGYYTAAQIMASQPNTVFPSPPAGVLVDGLQLGVNFTRFSRFPLRYSTTVADDFLFNFEALVRCKAEPAARLGLYPREAESECNHYRRRDGTGGCEFRPVCKASPATREYELNQRFVKSIWDPAKAR